MGRVSIDWKPHVATEVSMSCRQCQGIERLFNPKLAEQELRQYRRRGPSKTTKILIESILARGVSGSTLLDIGGGVGAIPNALLDAGAESVVSVEASNAYLEVAAREAERRGVADRWTFRHGDFVEQAADIPPADGVTLDRVICCYHDMHSLVQLAATRARRWIGLVFPSDTLLFRIGAMAMNGGLLLAGHPYRMFLHRRRDVMQVLSASGFAVNTSRRTLLWNVMLFDRQLTGT